MHRHHLQRLAAGTLFSALAGLLFAAPALADVSVLLGYDTRTVGEIEPCG